MAVDNVGTDVPIKFGDCRSSGFRDIRGAHFVSNEHSEDYPNSAIQVFRLKMLNGNHVYCHLFVLIGVTVIFMVFRSIFLNLFLLAIIFDQLPIILSFACKLTNAAFNR